MVPGQERATAVFHTQGPFPLWPCPRGFPDVFSADRLIFMKYNFLGGGWGGACVSGLRDVFALRFLFRISLLLLFSSSPVEENFSF